MFESLPFAPRKVEATEARLTRIYEAAKLGLKGDSLALASGMLPAEYRQLVQLDPIAEMAALKGKADAEMEMSQCLHKAARGGHRALCQLLIDQNASPSAASDDGCTPTHSSTQCRTLYNGCAGCRRIGTPHRSGRDDDCASRDTPPRAGVSACMGARVGVWLLVRACACVRVRA